MKNQSPRRVFRGAFVISIIGLTLCTPSLSLGWGPGGHMITAQIAFDRLNPRARAQVQALLAIPIDPAAVSARSKNFVNAAHWADDLRSVPAFKFLEPLHFIDKRFSTDGTRLPAIPSPNIVNALRDNVKILRTSRDKNARARALRLIIHFVGDIHQPLHCADRVSRALPDGDQGGNLVTIKISDANGNLRSMNLHSYWDGGLESFPKGGPPPQWLPPALSQIPSAAALARRANPPNNPALRLNDPFNYPRWADESFVLAKSVVYPGVSNGMEPSPAYKSKGVKVVRQRAAWGGYRLAALLNSIWP